MAIGNENEKVKDSDTVVEAARKAAAEVGSDAGANVAEDIQAYINESMETMQEMANEYYERMGEIAGNVANQAGHLYEGSQDYVRQHPGTTLMGAFAFGVLIGVLIRNR